MGQTIIKTSFITPNRTYVRPQAIFRNNMRLMFQIKDHMATPSNNYVMCIIMFSRRVFPAFNGQNCMRTSLIKMHRCVRLPKKPIMYVSVNHSVVKNLNVLTTFQWTFFSLLQCMIWRLNVCCFYFYSAPSNFWHTISQLKDKGRERVWESQFHYHVDQMTLCCHASIFPMTYPNHTPPL